MLRVGLTGGIASGKSEVANRLAARGAAVIDSDVLAREVVEPGTPGNAAVIDHFGTAVLAADGSLDRTALARRIFDDGPAREALNAIVHPLIRAAAVAREIAAGDVAVVVHVIPLLVETGQQDSFDVVVVVSTRPEVQLRRLTASRGLTGAEAESRIAAQAPLADKIAVADHVIVNDGSLADLRRRADDCWAWLSAQPLAQKA